MNLVDPSAPPGSDAMSERTASRSHVCERHFRESDILTSSKYVDSKTGIVVEAKLKIARLSSDAVPSVFPNCPAYLSAPAATSREAPAEKRMRLEAASLREAIANSLETHEEEETKHNGSPQHTRRKERANTERAQAQQQALGKRRQHATRGRNYSTLLPMAQCKAAMDKATAAPSSGGPTPTRLVPAHKGHCIHYWVLRGVLPRRSCVAV
ncbi:hypothetical protein MRX96_022016 [Rhipicephalus microplus]